MSKYTTELRWICEQAYNDMRKEHSDLVPIENAELNAIISAGCEKIFWKNTDIDIAMHYNNQFPIYDENHRLELCFKIIKHYYTREIASETFALWKLWINERMNEIMPYYNQLYESADIKYNPLYDVEYKRSGNKNGLGTNEHKRDGNYINNENGEINRNGNSSSVDNNSGNRENINKFSETPQNGLSGVLDGTYLTTANVDENTENNTNINNSNNEEQSKSEVNRSGGEHSEQQNISTNSDVWEEEIKGKMTGKSYAKMIMEYRDAILNIDKMIIDELKDLFFYLW